MNIPHVTFFAYFVIGLYPIFGLLFDALLPRHRAVLATLLLGFLFLPSVEIDLGGILYWNRKTAPFFVILIGVLFRDWALLKNLRIRWFDLPMVAWCIAPFFASVSNGLGLYDGVSQAFYQSIHWGGPYFLGRLHFYSRQHLVDLAKAMVIGALIYLPLCAFEIRFSPTLHYFLYGFNQHSFVQSIRGSLYRPMVFLQHGLMVAMWMSMCCLVSWVLNKIGKGVSLLGIPATMLLLALAFVSAAMQSLGALILALGAWSLAVFSIRSRGKFLLVIFALLPSFWAVSRGGQMLPSSILVKAVTPLSAERADSLAFRLNAEENLVAHAWRKPLFGWSNRSFDRLDSDLGGESKVVTDGLWIIAFSAYGLFGLLSLLLFHLVPVWVSFRISPPWVWPVDGESFLAGVLGLLIAAVSIDNLFNAMVNPVFILLMGALPTTLLGSYWYQQDEEEPKVPPAQPELETTRFRRLLGQAEVS